VIKNIQFILDDPDPNPKYKWVGGFAIMMNITRKLKKIKEISFSKWKIIISNGEIEDSNVSLENGKSLEITLFLDFKKISDCRKPKSVELVYKMIFDGLTVVWMSKNWNAEYLTAINNEIKSEKYKVNLIYGKDYQSPDKHLKAQLYCELFPDYADLYVRFINKDLKKQHDIKFLKGNLNPEMFYGFFINYHWPDSSNFVISDYHKEIFCVFNTKTNQFSLEYKPKIHTLEILKETVRKLAYTPYD
jgi:hypothetical protein